MYNHLVINLEKGVGCYHISEDKILAIESMICERRELVPLALKEVDNININILGCPSCYWIKENDIWVWPFPCTQQSIDLLYLTGEQS